MAKKLVAYFSASGTTAKAAQALAEAAGAALFEIRPAVHYTAKDLDWMDTKSRSSVEMQDQSSRPALAETTDLSPYDVVFLGFPIWWYVAPTIVNTFLEAHDLAGKTVVLFATSGGSGLGKCAAKLKGSVAPDTKLVEGRMLNGRLSQEELRRWAEKFN